MKLTQNQLISSNNSIHDENKINQEDKLIDIEIKLSIIILCRKQF